MAGVSRGFQSVVELTHQLGCFDVDRILIAERSLLNAENEGKVFYVIMQVDTGRNERECVRQGLGRDRKARMFENR